MSIKKTMQRVTLSTMRARKRLRSRMKNSTNAMNKRVPQV